MLAEEDRDWLTPHEVALLFDVAGRTVSNWIDAGVLPGYRLPGERGARRISKAALLEFARNNDQYRFIIERMAANHGHARPEAGPDGADRREAANGKAAGDRRGAARGGDAAR